MENIKQVHNNQDQGSLYLADTESVFGRQVMEHVFLTNDFMNYELQVLQRNACTEIVPMQFIREGDCLHTFYDLNNCQSLHQYIASSNTSSALERDYSDMICFALRLIEGVINCMEAAANYMLDIQKMHLSTQVFYYNWEKEQMVFTYIPSNAQLEKTKHQKFINLLTEMKDLFLDSEVNQMCNRFVSLINDKNLEYETMKVHLGILMRETIYIYGRNTRELRETETNKVINENAVNMESDEILEKQKFYNVKPKSLSLTEKKTIEKDKKIGKKKIYIIIQILLALILLACLILLRMDIFSIIGAVLIFVAVDLFIGKRLKLITL